MAIVNMTLPLLNDLANITFIYNERMLVIIDFLNANGGMSIDVAGYEAIYAESLLAGVSCETCQEFYTFDN